jgi:hypothetical protein
MLNVCASRDVSRHRVHPRGEGHLHLRLPLLTEKDAFWFGAGLRRLSVFFIELLTRRNIPDGVSWPESLQERGRDTWEPAGGCECERSTSRDAANEGVWRSRDCPAECRSMCVGATEAIWCVTAVRLKL